MCLLMGDLSECQAFRNCLKFSDLIGLEFSQFPRWDQEIFILFSKC